MDALITEVKEGKELDPRHADAAVEFLLDEGADDSKKADFLRALSAKGETPGEIAAFVEAFLERSLSVELPPEELDGPTIDVCGTGGDGLNLFNVSTTSMFIIAAGGGVVVKHGNRGVTSKSGGADVLEALGIDIEQGPEDFRATVRRAGVGFLYARKYHPAFKAVAPVRAQLAKEGVKTLFNLVGPITESVSTAVSAGGGDPAGNGAGVCRDFAAAGAGVSLGGSWPHCGRSRGG